MQKTTLSQVFARNLAEAMKKAGMTQEAMAKRSGVAQTTVSLYLRPSDRAPTTGKAAPSPTLERVGKLAEALGVDAWLLLHPDIAQALREQEFYRRIEEDFARLPPAEVEVRQPARPVHKLVAASHATRARRKASCTGKRQPL
jgi:transcriptional regulator with XRE-family HTH domain